MVAKNKKPADMGKLSKRVYQNEKKVEKSKIYPVSEAFAVVRDTATAKFKENVDVALELGVDAKQHMVRGVVNAAHSFGKTVRVAVFAKENKHAEAKAAGADLVGADELVQEVLNGKIEFDQAIATPDMMPALGKVAKVLGPKGLMPNPKLGTVTPDVAGAVKAVKAGQIKFKIDKNSIVHTSIGKTDFEDKKLLDNLKVLLEEITKAKPAGSKGTYLKKLYLNATMGPAVQVDLASVN